MRRYLIGAAVTALATVSVAAAAQPAPPPPPGVAQGTTPAPAPGAPHVRVMVMSDRVTTRDEVAKHVGSLFAKLDTNRDGFITKDEAEAIHHKMMAGMAKVGDVQHRLAQRGVFIGDRGAMFDRLDANHDGNISRQEFMAGKPQVREERVMIMRDGPGGAPGAPDGAGMHHMEGMHMGGMHMAGMGMHGFGGHLFEMADANHDGRVSLAEAQAAALAHFDKADLNHDGKITPDERARVHQEMRIERHPG
ncbi:MAG: hypothetical protein QOF05_770 [Sphingomonadales bacterium]|nr:hypothetical protein [Sphingomonadales bacterium]